MRLLVLFRKSFYFFLQIFILINSLYSKTFNDFFTKYKTITINENSIILSEITDIDLDNQSNIWLIDYDGNQVVKFDSEGNFLKLVASKGNGPGEVIYPHYIFITDSGNVFVASILNRISQFDKDGIFLNAFMPTDGHSVTSDLFVTNTGNILIGGPRDSDQTMIHSYDMKGNYIQSFCTYAQEMIQKNLRPFRSVHFYVDKSGYIYTVQPACSEITIYNNLYKKCNKFGEKSKYYKEPGYLKNEIKRDKKLYINFQKKMTYIRDVFRFKDTIFLFGQNLVDEGIYTYYIDIYNASSQKLIDSVLCDYLPIRLKNNIFIFIKEDIKEFDIKRKIVLCKYIKK